MAHAHASHHHHGVPGRAGNRRRMAVAVSLNLAMLAAGVAGAVVFHSSALLSDAGHVLADVAALFLGLGAAWLAGRPAAGRRTFGYHRTETLAALANGLTLGAVSVLVVVSAASRLGSPPHVRGWGVVAVGAVELAGNLAATVILIGGDRRDLNLEGVVRHSAADALGALGVVAAGIAVLATGWRYADPIAGIAIGVLILGGSVGLVRETLDVLMEAAPAGVDVAEVGRAMAAVAGVREIHDLHVWTVTSGFPALAAHVRVDPGHDSDSVRGALERLLAERFAIDHTTLQMTVERLIELEDRR